MLAWEVTVKVLASLERMTGRSGVGAALDG